MRCDRLQAAILGQDSGRIEDLSAELRTHTETCATCREDLQLLGNLAREARSLQPPLPTVLTSWETVQKAMQSPTPALREAVLPAAPPAWALSFGWAFALCAVLAAVASTLWILRAPPSRAVQTATAPQVLLSGDKAHFRDTLGRQIQVGPDAIRLPFPGVLTLAEESSFAEIDLDERGSLVIAGRGNCSLTASEIELAPGCAITRLEGKTRNVTLRFPGVSMRTGPAAAAWRMAAGAGTMQVLAGTVEIASSPMGPFLIISAGRAFPLEPAATTTPSAVLPATGSGRLISPPIATQVRPLNPPDPVLPENPGTGSAAVASTSVPRPPDHGDPLPPDVGLGDVFGK